MRTNLYDIDNVRQLLEQNRGSELLGKKVVLKNVRTYTEDTVWKVIGFDHEGTKNTIDLQSLFNLSNRNAASCISTQELFDEKINFYEDSNIRKYLNETICNGFVRDVSKLLLPMNVVSNKSI